MNEQIGYICLWRNVVCLFRSIVNPWDPSHRDASGRVLGQFGKLSKRRGASAWRQDGVEALEYWKISSLKIELNGSWKKLEELECAFGVIQKISKSRI
jgi:hypothetical protein